MRASPGALTRVLRCLLLAVAFTMIVSAAPAHEPPAGSLRSAAVEYRTGGAEHRDGEKLPGRVSRLVAHRHRQARDDQPRELQRRTRWRWRRLADRRPATNHAGHGDRFSRPASAWALATHAPASLQVYRR